MREIKFRAWDKENKMIIYQSGVLIDFSLPTDHFSSRYYISDSSPNENCEAKGFEKYELMQFTGLTDRLGKDIYEGDIVKYFINGEKENPDEIIKEVKFEYLTYTPLGDDNGCGNYCEVIGNIYENPELLK